MAVPKTIRCNLKCVNGEKVGTFQFDPLPRKNERIRTPDGRCWSVEEVEHVLNLSGTGTLSVNLLCWKVGE